MRAKEPTELGEWLLDQMNRRQLSQTDLGGAVGVAQATISRWIYQDIRPEREKIMLLPDALGLGRDARDELSRITGVNLDAAPSRHAASEPTAIHALAAEVVRMLDPESPIPDEDRQVLETLLDRIVDPYRKVMRSRRRKVG